MNDLLFNEDNLHFSLGVNFLFGAIFFLSFDKIKLHIKKIGDVINNGNV